MWSLTRGWRDIFLLIQNLRLHRPTEQIPLKEVRDLPQPIRGVEVRRHGEHLVQLLEGLPLRLGHEHQDQPPPDDVAAGVERERALRGEGVEERRPGDGEQEVEEPGRRGGQGHAVRSDVQGVGFGGVGERDGTLAGGVDDAEDVDAQRDAGDAGPVVRGLGDPEAEAGEEEGEGH